MDVRLAPEQRALRDAAVQVVDRLGVRAVGQLDDRERSAKLDAAVSASGWRELRTATDEGTPWSSAVEVAIVAEELGRGLADAPFVGPTLAAELRRRAGAPPTTAPETVLLAHDLGALAVAEGAPPSGTFAIDARGAASALVLVPGSEGHGLGRVTLQPDDTTTDLTRPIGAIAPDAEVEAVEGAGSLSGDDLLAVANLGLAVTSADLVGAMAGTVALATEYAKERSQYGQAIGSFQAVQHLLADAHVSTEGSRSVARQAAWAVDALPPEEANLAASIAKAYCARAARTVCEISIQVHGGIGNTWECLAHVYLRRALLSADLFGGVGPNLDRVLASTMRGTDTDPSGSAERREQHGFR
jgi:alkylation response protein AidB-like acyl-CoA dehydrogenase